MLKLVNRIADTLKACTQSCRRYRPHRTLRESEAVKTAATLAGSVLRNHVGSRCGLRTARN